jgi:hypothetical protein
MIGLAVSRLHVHGGWSSYREHRPDWFAVRDQVGRGRSLSLTAGGAPVERRSSLLGGKHGLAQRATIRFAHLNLVRFIIRSATTPDQDDVV